MPWATAVTGRPVPKARAWDTPGARVARVVADRLSGPKSFATRPTDVDVEPTTMVTCEMDVDCDRPATRRLLIEYPRGRTCEEFYCDGHTRTVREEFDLDKVEILETEPLR